MGIAAIIGIVSSVIQAVRAINPPEPPQAQAQAADRLFSQLDTKGQGSIGSADLQSAFERVSAAPTSTAASSGAASGAADLFSRLDGDSDGTVTRQEFTDSINRLAAQLDQHYMRMRMQGACVAAPAAVDAGFSREELTGQVSTIASNFDRADADGDGRVSLREARAFAQADAASTVTTAPTDNRNVELMLQVVRLMQAYGIVGGSSGTAGTNNRNDSTAAARISILG